VKYVAVNHIHEGKDYTILVPGLQTVYRQAFARTYLFEMGGQRGQTMFLM